MGCRQLQFNNYFSFVETEVNPQNDFRFVGNDRAESIFPVRQNEFKHSSAFSASSADTYYTTIDGGTPTVKNITYLIDPSNFTGYAQVLEESVNGNPTKSYTLGDDVLSQTTTDHSSLTTSHLLYDGHGSTRLLTSATSAITARYNYDAYGKNLFPANVTSPSATNMLYSGEQFDPNLQMQYLRARYYDQNNDRFNRLDPFAGNNYDPQSLHKYAYTHCNPVMGIDPSGRFSPAWYGIKVHQMWSLEYLTLHAYEASSIVFDLPLPSQIRPDIVNHHYNSLSFGEVYEIKPLSDYGVRTGQRQLAKYITELNLLHSDRQYVSGFLYHPLNHTPIPIDSEYAYIKIMNSQGVLYYHLISRKLKYDPIRLPQRALRKLDQTIENFRWNPAPLPIMIDNQLKTLMALELIGIAGFASLYYMEMGIGITSLNSLLLL